MPAKTTATDERAKDIVLMYEEVGKQVRKVVIEGKRVEVEFQPIEGVPKDAPDFIKW